MIHRYINYSMKLKKKISIHI